MTMESVSEIYRDGRPLMGAEYLANSKTSRRAKIIVVSAGIHGYEGIAVYDTCNAMMMGGPNAKRLMAAMKREVKAQLAK